MTTDETPTGEVREESLDDVLETRVEVGAALPLGELDGLGDLALRDHVLGLEAEAENARAEAEHWKRAAYELREEMQQPLVRAARVTTRLARHARERQR